MTSEPSRDQVRPARTALLVLGMHRSGTSAFARVFNLLGADLAKTLLPPSVDNRLGFWESRELLVLHDAILASAGTTWDDWTRFSPDWYDSTLATRFRENLLAYLVQDFGASTLFVIKDPRMCRLVRLWRETCEEFGAAIKVVIPIRNPLEVAQSLQGRHRFSTAKCHLLWLRHTLGAIQDTKGMVRCVVSYDSLLRDRRRTTAMISQRVQLTWPRASPSVEAEIDAFLGHQERHHVVDDDTLLDHPELSEWVKGAYRTLLTMTGPEEVPSAQADLDEMINKLDEASSLFDPLLKERARALTAAETELGTVRARLAENAGQTRGSESQLQQVTAELTDVKRRLDQAAAAVEQAHARLGEVSERLATTERQFARWAGRARALSVELAGLRRRPLRRILERFRPGPDLSSQIDPAFQNLLDDGYLFLGGLAGYRLQPSAEVQGQNGLRYALRLDRPNLSGLMLAPIIDLPDGSGSLGIELSTPEGVTIARARVLLTELEPHSPVRFLFSPLPASARHIVLRVDVRDATTPVRLFEWRLYRFMGLGRLVTRPFCALRFD